jgi:hypothetical protein
MTMGAATERLDGPRDERLDVMDLDAERLDAEPAPSDGPRRRACAERLDSAEPLSTQRLQ